MPVPAVSEAIAMQWPVQLHVSENTWHGNVKQPDPKPITGHSSKPSGLFWTSSETREWNSAWSEICAKPPIGRQPKQLHRYEVVNDPRVLIIREKSQLVELAFELRLITDMEDWEDWRSYCDASGTETWQEFCEHRVDLLLNTNELWGACGDKVDAVHIPGDAVFHERWMEDFEVESTVWFRPHRHLKHKGSVLV